jgi:hypothetical protein
MFNVQPRDASGKDAVPSIDPQCSWLCAVFEGISLLCLLSILL